MWSKLDFFQTTWISWNYSEFFKILKLASILGYYGLNDSKTLKLLVLAYDVR